MTPRTRNPLLALLALSLLAPIGVLFADDDPVVSIAVIDPNTNRRLYAVQNNDKIELEVGQTVLLQLFDPAWDNPSQARRHDVAGKFDVTGDRSSVKLTRPDHKGGTVFLTAQQMPKHGSPIRVTFDPEGNARSGAVFVDVEPAAGTTPVATPPATPAPSPGVQPDQANKLVTALYRGILLRDPDPGAQSWIEAIRRDGYSRIGGIARDLAESRESRITVYERENVCNQQRLVAMYKHLLNRSTDGIDQATWQRQLEQLNRGDVAGVVSALVGSAEFARAHGLDERIALR